MDPKTRGQTDDKSMKELRDRVNDVIKKQNPTIPQYKQELDTNSIRAGMEILFISPTSFNNYCSPIDYYDIEEIDDSKTMRVMEYLAKMRELKKLDQKKELFSPKTQEKMKLKIYKSKVKYVLNRIDEGDSNDQKRSHSHKRSQNDAGIGSSDFASSAKQQKIAGSNIFKNYSFLLNSNIPQ